MGRLGDIALVEYIRNSRDRDGLSWDEIQESLKKQGHTSRKFGKPIGVSDIRRIYLYGNAAYNRAQDTKKRDMANDAVQSRIPASDMDAQMRSILHAADLDDKTKIKVLKALVTK